MEREAKVDLLNRVLHGTVNSMLQYIENATPYVPKEHEADYEEIKRCRDDEIETVQELTDLIAALDGVPKAGVFPYWNIDLNYLDLRWMARFAAGHEEKEIALIEAELEDVGDDPRLHALLTKILARKRQHLELLRRTGGDAEAAAVAE